MLTINAEIREQKVRSRRLRRENYVPAVLYGKHLAESIPLKLPLKETEQFIKSNDVGAKVNIKIGGKTNLALLKELTREPLSGQPMHLSFMAISETEKVKAIAHINVVGKDALLRKGVLIHLLDEINYRALPAHLFEFVTVNVENMEVGDNIKVSDLEIAKNPNIEILTPLDTVILTLNPVREYKAEEAAEAASESEGAEKPEESEKEEKSEKENE